VTPAERRVLLDRYRLGYDAVAAAAAEAATAGLDVGPADGGWTPREVLHHLADSEMTAAIRLRRLLAEDAPLIAGYDEQEFARRLHYDRPVAASLIAVRGARESSYELLELLTEDEWARSGVHSESGDYGVTAWLQIYAEHPYDHAAQIRAALTAPAPAR
jgi:hypothetical protein